MEVVGDLEESRPRETMGGEGRGGEEKMRDRGRGAAPFRLQQSIVLNSILISINYSYSNFSRVLISNLPATISA